MLQKLEGSEVKINVDSKVKKQSVPNRNVLSYTGPSYYVVNLEEKRSFGLVKVSSGCESPSSTQGQGSVLLLSYPETWKILKFTLLVSMETPRNGSKLLQQSLFKAQLEIK